MLNELNDNSCLKAVFLSCRSGIFKVQEELSALGRGGIASEEVIVVIAYIVRLDNRAECVQIFLIRCCFKLIGGCIGGQQIEIYAFLSGSIR